MTYLDIFGLLYSLRLVYRMIILLFPKKLVFEYYESYCPIQVLMLDSCYDDAEC